MDDYKKIINYLYHQFPQYQQLGKQAYKADLSNITALCKLLDNPHKELPCIHIAGTNGKGSVTAFLRLGIIILSTWSFLAVKFNNTSVFPDHLFDLPLTNNFRISSASVVPPGSLVIITLCFLESLFFRIFICVDFPEPSPPSNVINLLLSTQIIKINLK